MVKCNYCGAEIQNASVCPYCGSKNDQLQVSSGTKEITSKADAGAKELNKTAKTMSKTKFKDATKSFGKVVSALSTGGPHAAAMAIGMEAISGIIEAFSPLIEVLKSPLEVLKGILQQSLVPLIQAIVPYVADFNAMLIENKDSIIALIRITTPFLAGLQFLIIVLDKNKEGINELIEALGPLIEELGNLANTILEDKDVMDAIIITAKALAIEIKILVIIIKALTGGIAFLREVAGPLGGTFDQLGIIFRSTGGVVSDFAVIFSNSIGTIGVAFQSISVPITSITNAVFEFKTSLSNAIAPLKDVINLINSISGGGGGGFIGGGGSGGGGIGGGLIGGAFGGLIGGSPVGGIGSAIGNLIGGGGGSSGGGGGGGFKFPGFQSGIDRVPETMPAIVHKDERITSAAETTMQTILMERQVELLERLNSLTSRQVRLRGRHRR